MDGTVPFLRYSRKKLRSVAGKSSVKTNDVEKDSKLSEGMTSKEKMGKSTIEEKGGGATTDITEKRNEGGETPLKRKRGADVEITLACLSSPERNASRLRTRKEVPSFREVDLCKSDSLRIIGKRIKVYWPDSRRWFIGRVKAFHRRKQLHAILYEDGDKEELDLRKERFELEVLPTENFHLRTEPNYGKRLTNVHSVEADNEFKEDAIRVIVSGLRAILGAESTKKTEAGNETAETFGTQITELVSGDDTEGGNVSKDFSKEAENLELPKRFARSNKKMASRNSKIGSSKSRCKKGSKEMKMKASDQDVESCRKFDDQEMRGRKTGSHAGKSIENNSISYEVQLTNSESDATTEEGSLYDVKVEWEADGKFGEKFSKDKEPASKKFGIVRKAEIGNNTESQRSPIRRRRSAVITNWIHDLHGLQGERKMKNGKSRENFSKEKELASKEAGEVRKAENISNAESRSSPIKRRRTAVIII